MINYSKYNDDDLLMLLGEKSPVCDQSFYALYHRYSEQLNVYCLFKAANESDAEEIFQDTWMKFYNSVRAGTKPDIVMALLYKIARNLSIDKYRSNKSSQYLSLDSIDIERIAAPFSLNTQIERNDLLEVIGLAVNNLDDIYKETFVLQWFGGLSLTEIADVLGETIGCIKMRSHRAMSDLIKSLKPYIKEISN